MARLSTPPTAARSWTARSTCGRQRCKAVKPPSTRRIREASVASTSSAASASRPDPASTRSRRWGPSTGSLTPSNTRIWKSRGLRQRRGPLPVRQRQRLRPVPVPVRQVPVLRGQHLPLPGLTSVQRQPVSARRKELREGLRSDHGLLAHSPAPRRSSPRWKRGASAASTCSAASAWSQPRGRTPTAEGLSDGDYIFDPDLEALRVTVPGTFAYGNLNVYIRTRHAVTSSGSTATRPSGAWNRFRAARGLTSLSSARGSTRVVGTDGPPGSGVRLRRLPGPAAASDPRRGPRPERAGSVQPGPLRGRRRS